MAWLLLGLSDLSSNRYPNNRDLLESLYYRVFGSLRYFCNLIGPDGSGFESPGYNISKLDFIETLSTVDRFFENKDGKYRGSLPGSLGPIHGSKQCSDTSATKC